MSGWIKLHRKLSKHWLSNDLEKLGAWVKILMEVNHKDEKVLIHGELIICKRGQSLNSLQTWAKVLGKGWGVQKIRTFFNLLKNDSMINTEGLRKTTRLTVCNYEKYQVSQQADNTQNNTQITDRQHTDNNKQELKELIRSIIEFFNSTCGTNFKPSTKETQKSISGRLSEGYTIDDFKKVIQFQYKQWEGTSQNQYLTPSTLFRPANFEKYLNNANKVSKVKSKKEEKKNIVYLLLTSPEKLNQYDKYHAENTLMCQSYLDKNSPKFDQERYNEFIERNS